MYVVNKEVTLNQAWAAFSFYDIKEIVGLAGIDVTRLARLEQRPGGGASKGQLITALDHEIGNLDEHSKSTVLTRIAEQIIERRPTQKIKLDACLERLGWQFVEGRFKSASH